MNDPSDTVPEMLERLVAGDRSVERELQPLVYQELRRVAGRILGARGDRSTLQPTVLVHEAWLKLCQTDPENFTGRQHFLAVASKAMRQVLSNYARDRAASKRGGPDARRITIDRVVEQLAVEHIDVIALDDALEELARLSERQARVVELRVFGGLTIEETAAALDLGPTTVKAEWSFARAWLIRLFQSGHS